MSESNLFAAPARLRRLQIEITTGCNLGCVGCQRTLGIADGTWRNANMPVQRFLAVLRNAPPADAMILQGIGEPTLHPRLPDMITAVREAGKFGLISFNTNALLRDTAYYAALRQRGLGHISISVDSLRPDTAEALRAGTDCDALRAAIPALIALFGGAVTLSIVLSRRNLPELPELLATLHGLGARAVEVQPLVSYAAAVEPMALNPAELRSAQTTMAAVQRQLPGLSILPAAAFTPNGTRCRRPFHAAYVTVGGFLTPCCLTNDAALFGNTSLETTPWAEAWNSQGVRRFLSSYFDHEPDICHGCAFNASGSTGPRPDAVEAKRLHLSGDALAATVAYQRVLGGPDAADALQGLGLLRFQGGDATAALPLLLAAEALTPDPRTRFNVATVLAALGRTSEAVERQHLNVTTAPEYIPSYNALVQLLEQAGDRAGAASVLAALANRALGAGQEAIVEATVTRLAEVAPDHPTVPRLANRLRITGANALALTLLNRRLARDPADLGSGLTRAMARLAVVHETEAEVAARRAAYQHDLAGLLASAAAADTARLAAGAEQVGTAKPFFLSYQGEDDHDLQRDYGAVVSRMMAAVAPAIVPRPARGRRIRVGFATAYFHLHSVSKLFGGWMRHLDRERFEVVGYHLGEGEDATSAELAAVCDRFHCGVRDDAAWAEAIRNDELHVLIYPEIGMHPVAVRLACRRLAPLQCVAWGHPVTTGLPAIDVFLSSALMEPPDGQRHYTERLVKLPNLSICYDALPMPQGSITRAGLGFSDADIVYVCCQSLFKYHPRDDRAVTMIAAAVPNAKFLFIGDTKQDRNAQLLQRRLAGAFRAAGLEPDRHLCFTPPTRAEEFPSLLRASDVYLDSIGWSGGNTTLEAVTCDLPVVTMPGAFMRGRHSAAILTMMGLQDSIADTPEQYAALATALADPGARRAMRDAVAQRKHLLFGDRQPIRALEEFLTREIDARCGGSALVPA